MAGPSGQPGAVPPSGGVPFLQQQALAAYRAGRLGDALQFCRQILKQHP